MGGSSAPRTWIVGILTVLLAGTGTNACLPASVLDGAALAPGDAGISDRGPDSTRSEAGREVGVSDRQVDGGQDARIREAGADAAVADASLDVQSSDAARADAVTGDAATSDADWSYRCSRVGDAPSDGIFSLQSFGDHLYAGLFGYGHEAESMLYRYPAWGQVQPGVTGVSESICAMEVFDGWLYANTESSGDIFRSSNGSNWERVYDGDSQTVGCGLEVFAGTLFALNYGNQTEQHGRILKLGATGFDVVFDSNSESLFLRELVAYDGVLYAFGAVQGQGVMLTSSNGTSWARQNVSNRYFRGHVWDGYLWLGSTDSSSNGETAIWRFDGSRFERKLALTTRYVTDLQALDGHLFASTSNGWKDDPGPALLLLSRDRGQSWETSCTFNETAVWMLAAHGGELFLGTWQYGGHGSLYRVERVATSPGLVDCSRIAAADPDWEVCERGSDSCAGVFTDGAGCHAYCAAAGLVCLEQYEGNPGCIALLDIPLGCNTDTGHQSDWCRCGSPPARDAGTTTRDGGDDAAACTARAGSLSVGATHTLRVDGHSGDEDTTQPKSDLNDGANGDNPRFRRHNVARAHNDYWYTSSHQEPGEPDPAGEQWVDYTPDFSSLGVGCYHIVARYRGSDTRATYPALYHILDTRDGNVLHQRVQQRSGGDYVDEDLGNHFMCPASRVRIQDPGAASITFNEMRFVYVGQTCP